MADQNDIFHRNIPGRFYVDNSCIDCGQCPDMAREFFRTDEEERVSFVHRQPETAEEFELARDALERCLPCMKASIPFVDISTIQM